MYVHVSINRFGVRESIEKFTKQWIIQANDKVHAS